LDREIRVLQSQLRSLEQRLEGLRAAASSSLEEQMESHALELRAASAKKLLDDLVRRQQEVSEAAHSRSIGARVLALAPTPLRPSSISPYLLIPPAVFAFALLGAAISVFRTQLDRTLQSEPEVIAELGIPSLGAVSQLPSSRSAPDYRALVDQRSQPFSQSIRSTAITALNAIPPRYDARAILVTPCVSSEAATATALSMSIGVCIARLGHHVLVIAFGALDGSSGPVLDRSADRGAQLHDQSISAAVQHDAQLGLDCFSVRQISGDPMSLVASQQFTDILHRLRARYDCIIIDAPSVFSSAEVRLLATKVDGAILAIKCGSTHRDAAVTASQLLRQVSPLGEPAAKVYAVLTDVYATAHSEFDR
jgi:Mrp family chromosome partitioning ATPase